jgi:hypothetical protein
MGKKQKSIAIKGNIFAPLLFAIHRKPDPQYCHAIINIDGRCISFVFNENNDLKSTVKGDIQLSKHLELFKLGKQFNDLTAFGNHLKKFKRFFSSTEENMILVSAFKKFKVKISQELEKESDDRGKFVSRIDQSVENDLPTSFTIRMPVFKDMKPRSFLVEIFFSVRDKGLTVWMESSEVEEIIDSEVDIILNDEKEGFEHEGYLVINE